METKNTIINNYAASLLGMIGSVNEATSRLNDNEDESKAIITTINVLLESVRSQTVLLQNAIDKY